MPTTWNFDLPYEERDEHEDDDWCEGDDDSEPRPYWNGVPH